MDKSITILFLAANPVDSGYRLRLDKEVREISEKLRGGKFHDRINLVCEWSVRISDLQRALLDHQPDIVHFSGHGTRTAGIVLEDNNGKSRTVDQRALAGLFDVLKDNIRAVVLNACYAEDQAKWLTGFIDYTIGMSDLVGDAAAIIFSAYFYQALAFGRTVRTAFDLALSQLNLSGISGADVPRLLVRSGVDESIPLIDLTDDDSPARQQNVNVTGDGNKLVVGGRDVAVGDDIH